MRHDLRNAGVVDDEIITQYMTWYMTRYAKRLEAATHES
jgi:hypothetical protein